MWNRNATSGLSRARVTAEGHRTLLLIRNNVLPMCRGAEQDVRIGNPVGGNDIEAMRKEYVCLVNKSVQYELMSNIQ